MLKRLISTAIFGFIAAANSAQAAVIQTTKLSEISTLEVVENSQATLIRRENEIEMNLDSENLPAGVYTVWWIIFNEPSFCVEGCGGDDFARPEVNASALWAAEGFVDDSGLGSFAAQLEENYLPANPVQLLFGPGLLDSFQAEIQPIIRWHGPPNPLLLEEQLTTFNGGCTTVPTDGLFPCENRQVAVFEAAAVPESSPIIGLIALGILEIALRRRS